MCNSFLLYLIDLYSLIIKMVDFSWDSVQHDHPL